MFWRFGFQSQTPIDTLLDKEGVTLIEVLDEEDVVVDCKSHHKKLIDYFCKPEIMEALLLLITTPPSADLDDSIKYKHPSIAAEILSSDVTAFCDVLLQNQKILENFWNFLDQPPPLNALQGSFFAKVLTNLIGKRMRDSLTFLRTQKDFLVKLLKHIGTSGILDIILKIISCEEYGDGFGVVQFLVDNDLIPLLIEKLDPNLPGDVHYYASLALAEIISFTQIFGPQQIIIERLKREDMVSKLLDLIIENKDAPYIQSSIINGLNILIDVLQRGLGFFQEHESENIGDIKELLKATNSRLPQLHEIMINSKPRGVEKEVLQGSIENPIHLGATRLKIIEFFVVILHANDPQIQQSFIELKIIPFYIDLFFKYQWNNFLHSLIHDMIIKIFNLDVISEKDFIISVLKDSQLLDKIVEAAKGNDAGIEERKGTRRGYMGHLILISNHLVKFSEFSNLPTEIQSYFKKESWKDFERVSLYESNMKDNKQLGGHKPMHFIESTDNSYFALNDSDVSPDQFARFLCHQMAADLPERFGEEEDFDEDESTREKADFGFAGAYVPNPSERPLEELDDSDDENEHSEFTSKSPDS